MNQNFYYLAILTGALILSSCDEHPNLKSVLAKAGNGDTSVTAVAADADGSITAIGETYATSFGSEPVYPSAQQSNMLVFDAVSKSLVNATPSPIRDVRGVTADPATGTSLCWTQDRIFRLSKSSTEWKDITLNLGVDGITYIQVVASASTLYATVDAGSGSYTRYYLFTTDGGDTWFRRTNDLIYIIDPRNPCRLIAAGSSFVSTDCGVSWQQRAGAVIPVTSAAPDPRFESVIYAFKYSQMPSGYRFQFVISKDWGSTWNELPLVIDRALTDYPLIISPDPASRSGIFVLTSATIYKSSDQGQSWTIFPQTPKSGPAELSSVYADYLSGCLYLLYSLNSPQQGNAVEYSRDGFLTREVAYNGTVRGLAVSGSGSLLVATVAAPSSYLAKFSFSGEPTFIRYIAGSVDVTLKDVAVSPSGEILVTGSTSLKDFPKTTSLAADETSFIMRLSSDGQQLLSTTRLPGQIRSTVAPDGTIWAFGSTPDSSYPPQPTPTFAKNYLVSLTPDGGKLLTSQRVGSLGPDAVAADNAGAAYLMESLFNGPRAPNALQYGWTRNPLNGGFTQWPLRSSQKSLSMQVLPMGDLLIAGACGYYAGCITSPAAFQSKPAPLENVSALAAGPVPLYDASLLRVKPDGSVRFGTLIGGEDLDWFTSAAYGKYGNIVAVGQTQSNLLPTRGLVEMKTDTRVGFIAKFDTGLTSLHYATYLNRMNPAAIFPHPQGGYLVVGSGRADKTDGPNGIVFLRVTEEPQALPRIDSVRPVAATTGKAGNYPILSGGILVVAGEGFASDSIVLFNDRVVPFQWVDNTQLRVTIPGGTTRGAATVRIETKSIASQTVGLEVQ